MANNEEAEETAVHGNEWEVVSLTASAYAAASGPKQVEVSDDDKGKLIGTSEAETSRAMFMSGHFVFPPSQHENLPLEPENTKAHTDQSVEDAVSEMVVEEGGVSDSKEKENWNIKGLNVADEVPGIQFFDHKGNMLSISGAEFEEGATLPGLNLVDEEQSFYSATKFSSFHSDATIGGSTIAEDNTVIAEPIESSEQSLDSDIPYLPNSVDEDQYTGSKLPCEAWWKRRAASLYAHAKEANAFWSIFITAAVMGLVILGQQWQQERWQVLQLKWQLSLNDERMGRMLGPISRLKDAVVGGQRRGSCILGSTASER